MLIKYLLPLGVLVALQVILSSVVEAQVDGEREDLDSAELFLRPVVIKYGHDHPGIYTWQGGSGVGMGWGQYKPQAVAGWGWEKGKKKKGKKKKDKKKKDKKKKEKKKKEKKKKEKKKKEKKGGWGWSWGWMEEGGKEESKEEKEKEPKDWDDEAEKARRGPIGAQPLAQSIVARFGGPAEYVPVDDYDYENPARIFQNAYNF